MGPGTRLEGGMLRATAGPDPAVGTSTPPFCHGIVKEGPQRFTAALPWQVLPWRPQCLPSSKHLL